MAVGEKITVYFDAKTQGFAKVRADINATEGALNKAKVGATGLGNALKANVTEIAATAGAALVTFGVKSVKAFNDAAIEAGKFADATGLAVDDASRWIEVASDVGVEASTIQGAFTKMNKSLADGKDAWSKYGIEVVKTEDGLVDSNATMVQALSRIGAIEDPTLRAQAAQEVFGKSYAEVSELMEMSAGQLQSALASVSDEQVITDDKLRKAKEFRTAMDNLQDAVVRVQNAVGEQLTPALTDAADAVNTLIEADAIGWLGKVSSAADKVTIDITEVVGAFETAADVADYLFGERIAGGVSEMEKLSTATVDTSSEIRNFSADTLEASNAVDDLEGSYKSLTDELSNEEAWLDARDAIDDYTSKVNEAGASNRTKRQALIDLKQELINYLSELEGVPVEKQTEILALIDAGNIAEVERQLAYLTRSRATGITVTTGGDGRSAKPGTIGIGATGGIVTKPTLSIIGEAGPEAVVPLNQMPGASPLPGGSGGGITVIVNGANPEAVIAAIKRYERNNGRGWRS